MTKYTRVGNVVTATDEITIPLKDLPQVIKTMRDFFEQVEWEAIERSLGYPVSQAEREQVGANELTVPDNWEPDWRRFVPDYVIAQWGKLDRLGKVCVFITAREAAERWKDSAYSDE